MHEEKTLTNAVLVYLVSNGDILLPIKKKKIGAGRRNGYGGEPKPNETLIEACVRETREETGGVEISPESLVKIAILCFSNQKTDGTIFICTVHVYFAYVWEGEPKETEEMGPPEWFKKKDLPLQDLMLADQTWLSVVVRGKKIIAKASYGPFQQYLFEPVTYEIVESFPSE